MPMSLAGPYAVSAGAPGQRTGARGEPSTAPDTPSPSVWIDDAHLMYRRGMAVCLTAEGFRVVGESTRLSPSPPLARVDVLVFEADRGGLRRVAHLARGADVRLVATVQQATDTLLNDAVEAGVAGIVLRERMSPPSLVGTIRAALTGSTALPGDVLARMLDTAAGGGRHTPNGLSRRELEVLRRLAEGEDTQEIATALCFSERTVKNVVHDLLMKTNCRNRAHAVATATRQGLI